MATRVDDISNSCAVRGEDGNGLPPLSQEEKCYKMLYMSIKEAFTLGGNSSFPFVVNIISGDNPADYGLTEGKLNRLLRNVVRCEFDFQTQGLEPVPRMSRQLLVQVDFPLKEDLMPRRPPSPSWGADFRARALQEGFQNRRRELSQEQLVEKAYENTLNWIKGTQLPSLGPTTPLQFPLCDLCPRDKRGELALQITEKLQREGVGARVFYYENFPLRPIIMITK